MDHTEHPKPVVVKVTENGPLRVKDPITLIDADGTPYEVKHKTFFLCRCGASSTRAVLRRYTLADRLRGRPSGPRESTTRRSGG